MLGSKQSTMLIADLWAEYRGFFEFLDMEQLGVNTPGCFGNYPINLACVRGNVEEVMLLLTEGADINQRGEYGSTPLCDAVGAGHTHIVRLLVARGANVHLKDEMGYSPKDRALLKPNERGEMIIILSKAEKLAPPN